MSDGRSSAGDSEGDPDSSDDEGEDLEPGGGPKRVVSETSVDDILDSLDETKAGAESDDDEASTTRLEGDYVESVADDATIGDAAGSSADADAGSTTDGATAVTTDGPDRSAEAGEDGPEPAAADADRKAGAEPGDGESEDGDAADDRSAGATADDAIPEADAAEAADGPSIDPDAVGDDESAAELADRIAAGTVTGADVRAAEAGDGREETPEIDEIELTMDDIEASTTTHSETGDGSDGSDDAGPLAGSIDAGAEAETTDEAQSEAADTQSGGDGLLARLKRYFAR